LLSDTRERSVPFTVKPFKILTEKEKFEAAKKRAQALQAQTQLLESNRPDSLGDSLGMPASDDADGEMDVAWQLKSGAERFINITRYL